MNAVWKYPLTLTDRTTHFMPAGAKLLHVALQCGTPCVWAQVDPDREVVPVRIVIVGTGHREVEDGDEYVGTFQLGGLVLHVYRRRKLEGEVSEDAR